MPTYDYRCKKCGHRFEVFHGIKDETPRRCPRCRGRAQRVPAGGAGLIFRGSGFYITDYRSRDYKEKASKEHPAEGKAEAPGPEVAKSDKTKPEAQRPATPARGRKKPGA